jgi:hypothetical protein
MVALNGISYGQCRPFDELWPHIVNVAQGQHRLRQRLLDASVSTILPQPTPHLPAAAAVDRKLLRLACW